MKRVLYGAVLTIVMSVGAHAQQLSSTESALPNAAAASTAEQVDQETLFNSNSNVDTSLLNGQSDDAAFFGHGGFGPRPGPGFGPRPGPGFGPRPGPGFGPRPGGFGPGPRPGFGPRPGWAPRPGWVPGWNWNRTWRPGWFRPGIILPAFAWAVDAAVGEWQCTAYNANTQAFTDYGADQNQAAYDALYACGGADYEAAGCYIPEGYCQVR